MKFRKSWSHLEAKEDGNQGVIYFLRRQHRPAVVREQWTEPAQERRQPPVASL